MCTLTIIDRLASGAAGVRVVVNRDEQRDRPAALAPRWHRAGACPECGTEEARALWPVDPAGGGTWISVNEHGLVLALLNMNPRPRPALPSILVSRGVLIPRLAGCREPAHVMDRVFHTDLARFAPFRLVAARATSEGVEIQQAWWDRSMPRRAPVALADACFVSSGLGDDMVAPRVRLFRQTLAQGGEAAAQDRFHAHAWKDSPELSVMMTRDDARTVSVTTVEVAPGASPEVRMDYRAVRAAASVVVGAGASRKALRAADTADPA